MKSLVFKLMFVYVDLIPFLKHIKTAANYFTNKLETVFSFCPALQISGYSVLSYK